MTYSRKCNAHSRIDESGLCRERTITVVRINSLTNSGPVRNDGIWDDGEFLEVYVRVAALETAIASQVVLQGIETECQNCHIVQIPAYGDEVGNEIQRRKKIDNGGG